VSNTDLYSFAPDTLFRGGVKVASSGISKPSLTTSGAADHIAYKSWDGLLGVGTDISYAFRINGTSPADDTTGFSQFTALQIAATQKALTGWSDVANVHFTRVDDGNGYSNYATILFGNVHDGEGAGFTLFPGSRLASAATGDVWINDSLDYNQVPVIGDYGGQVLIHEIGHALGLSHPGDYDASDDVEPTYDNSTEYFEDSRQYTVMTYFASTNTGASLGAFSAAPLLDDITSIQRLYGANMATRADDTVYGFHSTAGRDWYEATSPSSILLFAVWDGGGKDTFDFSGYSDDQRIDLREGDFSDVGGWRSNVSIAYGVTIENAIGGSGSDTIIGNSAANLLDGGGGNDTLFGEAGNDTLRANAGDDQLDGGSGTNLLDGGDGSDLLLLPGTIADYRASIVAGTYVLSGNGITDNLIGIESVATRSTGAPTNNASYSLAFFLHRAGGGATSTNLTTDFNGDGRSDILWRHDNGAVSTWQFGGSSHGDQIQQSIFNGAADPSWKAVDTGDFNGDAISDILWRNSSGEVAIWHGSNHATFAPDYGHGAVGSDWAIVAVGDLNADGEDDLLWRNTNGAVSAWYSTGMGFAEGAYDHAPVVTSWKIEGIADFNRDGRGDILWRNDNGSLSIWTGQQSGFAEATYSDNGVGTDWHIQGLADFDGDGRSDILWRHDNGSLSIWLSNGMSFTQAAYNDSSVGTDWHITLVGDFNSDGRADLLWKNDNGAISTWEYNGAGFDKAIANTFVGPGWSVISHHFPI